ncbi:hypothetical protein SLEP1_g41820 [Rubroshorea leprosula]|uniref:Uncharacterized protein n=1 Tax=Rubroshorea leprosula TaxID=152421 RepID=A0AAV5L8R4_9ROSI|nr:hypothetical protein SLEP1_g41820 [Rubroshorea leprosula]
MRLVGIAYGFLKDRGFLPNFGRFSGIGIFLLLTPAEGVLLYVLVLSFFCPRVLIHSELGKGKMGLLSYVKGCALQLSR